MKKILSYIKQDLELFKEIMIAVMSYKVAFVIVVILFILGLVADVKGVNAIYGTLELVGVAIIIALLAVIKMCFDKPVQFLAKVAIFSIMWLGSCLALVDFNDFTLLLAFKIITAFEYIFIGCLLPELVSKMEELREKAIQDNALSTEKSGISSENHV
ncbi:hypothetical protein SAMN04487884_1516 [Butyrivibrio fibrisolvens]|uniref:Uncharacterized protein n=1 Tax=Butyrivibrio fibrisolvens TaxID=831 RepID=A0A1H9XAB6_BUTFI|nr:hypothetical protein [Butyrivibrio fibrisolvens]SES43085.1 hypothetical protein SAMN04487884_1516 [Butyrivibrio fibrisolvens]